MKTLDYINDLEAEFSVELIGNLTSETEDLETMGGQTADSITYDERRICVETFTATGFKMYRDGVVISANLKKPVVAVSVSTEEDGCEIDTETDAKGMALAILNVLGSIPAGEGSLLSDYAGR